MIKRIAVVYIFILFSVFVNAQTLFTYGNKTVTKDEFLTAFFKNNNNPSAGSSNAKAIPDYLNLYINSRLKISEAYSLGYDTLPHVKMEVANLRSQVIDNYLSDPEGLAKLTKEAFERSQKDIHVAQIFISNRFIGPDSVIANDAIHKIYDRLNKAEDFATVATQTSQDPGIYDNKGDIGWITSFTLPYFFENYIYALKPGEISPIIRSKIGYHIFKNLGERKALGNMKAKQILLAFPPRSDSNSKKQTKLLADSLYKRIILGSDFSKLATTFSNDYLTAQAGGSMPDFGIGKYSKEFEKNVWALQKDAQVSKPFSTLFGYHIVKRISKVPVPAVYNSAYEAELRQKVLQDQRWETARQAVLKKVIAKANIKTTYDKAVLWAFTDSLLDRRALGIGSSMTKESSIFTFADSSLKANDWINFAQTNRFRSNGSGRKSYDEVMNEFVNAVAFNYHKDHLEFFNESFRNQMNDFKDGNLFFEIMQHEVWGKASTDTAGLRSLFESNQKKYAWSKSADVILFFCTDKTIADKLYGDLKKNPADWRKLTEPLGTSVITDSSRLEWEQIPSAKKIIPQTGMLTLPISNASDKSSSFAYIVKTYSQPSLRTYEEAKPLVINDYQSVLETQWVNQLKKKYPVAVNNEVLQSILK